MSRGSNSPTSPPLGYVSPCEYHSHLPKEALYFLGDLCTLCGLCGLVSRGFSEQNSWVASSVLVSRGSVRGSDLKIILWRLLGRLL